METLSTHMVQVGDGRCIRCGKVINTSAQALCGDCLGAYAQAAAPADLAATRPPLPAAAD